MTKWIALVTNTEGTEITPTHFLVHTDSKLEGLNDIADALRQIIVDGLCFDSEEIQNFEEIIKQVSEGEEITIESISKSVVLYSLDYAESEMKKDDATVYQVGALTTW
jgi:hypothetical protein